MVNIFTIYMDSWNHQQDIPKIDRFSCVKSRTPLSMAQFHELLRSFIKSSNSLTHAPVFSACKIIHKTVTPLSTPLYFQLVRLSTQQWLHYPRPCIFSLYDHPHNSDSIIHAPVFSACKIIHTAVTPLSTPRYFQLVRSSTQQLLHYPRPCIFSL